MRIGFIGGTGEEGMGLAYRLAKAGHSCVIGSRKQEKAEASVAELVEKDSSLDLSAAVNEQAAAQSEIVLVTTPYKAQSATLPPLSDALAGKIVVSTVVPMAFDAGQAALIRVPEGSAAQQEQALLPRSTVVSAFQTLSARKLLRGGPLDADVVVCSDEEEPKRTVMALAEQIEGIRAVDGGPLAYSAVLEGITVLLVSINRNYKTQAGVRIAGLK